MVLLSAIQMGLVNHGMRVGAADTPLKRILMKSRLFARSSQTWERLPALIPNAYTRLDFPMVECFPIVWPAKCLIHSRPLRLFPVIFSTVHANLNNQFL